MVYPQYLLILGASLSMSVATLAAEYSVQIGAFGKRPATSFAEQAAQHGELLVTTDKSGLTRVSIGRFTNRVAATDALVRLRNAGYADAYVTRRELPGTSADNSVAQIQLQPKAAQTRQLKAEVISPRPGPTTQSSRFRIRTHDTRSGATTDIDPGSTQGDGGAVVAGLGINDVPTHLRDRLVYVDGAPHIKDGERFIPLAEALTP